METADEEKSKKRYRKGDAHFLYFPFFDVPNMKRIPTFGDILQ